MVNIRQATVHDLLQMQTTNLWCLPENYQVRPLFVNASSQTIIAVILSTLTPFVSLDVPTIGVL
jgi:hypothetical protein